MLRSPGTLGSITKLYGNAKVSGNAKAITTSDYIVFKNDGSSGRYFTWTKSNDM